METCYRQSKGPMRYPNDCAYEKTIMRPGCYTKNMEEFPVAMAYVPWQYWNEQYELNKALQVGTIFPDLDKPFLGARGVKG